MSPAVTRPCIFQAISARFTKTFLGTNSRYSTLSCCKSELGTHINPKIRSSSNTQLTVLRWFKSSSNESKTKPLRIGLSPIQRVSGEPGNFKKLLKPFIFTVGVCGVSYVGCTVWQYENMRSDAISQLHEQRIQPWKKQPSFKQGELRRHLNAWWNNLTDGQQLAMGIILVNVVVFCMWRIRRIEPFMVKYFSSNPSSKTVCVPMMLSTFSHFSILHLVANMYVLFSFSGIAGKIFGKEQLLGVYLSAGVISSFASYVHKIATKTLSPSLGASGALMAILAPICVKYPDAKIAIVFIPFLTFSAGSAIAVVMGIDVVGILLGWRFLDHAAHLGGALFGISYLFYGQGILWKNRENVMVWWHKFRESLTRN